VVTWDSKITTVLAMVYVWVNQLQREELLFDSFISPSFCSTFLPSHTFLPSLPLLMTFFTYIYIHTYIHTHTHTHTVTVTVTLSLTLLYFSHFLFQVGGISSYVGEGLKREGRYDRFYTVVDREWRRAFPNLQGTALPLMLPNTSIPVGRLPPNFTLCNW
jgi:hypothetical protein